MLTMICGDLAVRTDDAKLTADEAREREAHREALVNLIAEIAAPAGDPPAARRTSTELRPAA